MPCDKRRWVNKEQTDFLLSHFPAYLEAQAARNYTRFWPSLFQSWFAKFPLPDPLPPDCPTDSEDADSDDEGSDASSDPSSSSQGKRKRKSKTKSKKRSKIVSILPWRNDSGSHWYLSSKVEPSLLALPLTEEQKIAKKKGRIIRQTQKVTQSNIVFTITTNARILRTATQDIYEVACHNIEDSSEESQRN